ncbi:MAG: squalene/phytoene synthase family protein [Pseudomonadota bacterium]
MTSPASDSLKEIHLRLDARIRSVDEPRWLSSRYADHDARTTLIILYAFYYELARVRLVVTDQTMGNIRFQWWRDALEELAAGKVRQHDVVLALAEELQKARLYTADLLSMIDQHEAAYLANDRSLEPEDQLIQIAAKVCDPEKKLDDKLAALALEWAACRRGEGDAELSARLAVASRIRPAVVHLRLRHAWAGEAEPSALEIRASILLAMLTGRV